jgi:sigma-B regulation protein RsbU (phosphoserine phosphatase)
MTKEAVCITKAAGPVKTYPNTLQRLAKHFWHAGTRGNILEFADDLGRNPDIAVVCITDESLKPLGIIRREQLFLSLSRRFGRELMARKTVEAGMEAALIYPGESNIFMILDHLRDRLAQAASGNQGSLNMGQEFMVLVDFHGAFSGILSLQDLSNYMVEMTNDDITLASLLQDRFLANVDEVKEFSAEVDTWRAQAKGVGGDFYFIRKVGDSRFFASLCDVSGKGVAAALVVSLVWGFLRSATLQRGLKNLLVSLNTSIVGSFHMEKYLTGFFLIYDSRNRLLRIADMGHAHAIFLRNGRPLSLKKTRVNMPIGIEPDIDPVICALPVRPGDRLLIYSDGISEQDNPAGEEFGEGRIFALAKVAAKQNRRLSEILPAALEGFRQYAPQRDDMTFLSFRF